MAMGGKREPRFRRFSATGAALRSDTFTSPTGHVPRWATPLPRDCRGHPGGPRVPDRKLIEAQVDSGCYRKPPTYRCAGGHQSGCRCRSRSADSLDEERRNPKGPRPVKRVMPALAANSERIGTRFTLWRTACEQWRRTRSGYRADLSDSDRPSCATPSHGGCAVVDFLVEFEIDGGPTLSRFAPCTATRWAHQSSCRQSFWSKTRPSP